MTGSGTLVDPYVIWDVNDLQNVNLDLTAWYELGADIDATATSGWNAGLGFIPIGNWIPGLLVGFSGHFDGRGHIITNLFINRRRNSAPVAPSFTMYCVGLFYCIDNGGIVQNMNLVTQDITGYRHVGAIAGQLGRTTMLDGTWLGTGSGFLTNCTVSGGSVQSEPHVAGKADGLRVGGACGYIGYDSTITNVNSENVSVTSFTWFGGLVGESVGTAQNCHSTGCTLTCAGTSLWVGMGGLIGENFGLIDTCFSNNAVTCLTGGRLGGLVGENYGQYIALGNGTIRNSYATGNVVGGVTKSDWVGGLVGWVQGGTLESCYATGSVAGEYYIGGLLGYCVGGNVDVAVSGCRCTGAVSGSTWAVGGFVGEVAAPNAGHGDTFERCYATGNVTAAADAMATGGFFGSGYDRVTISQCFAQGNVATGGGNDNWTGGFLGWMNNTTVSDCYARGSVNGNRRVGGFLGYISDGTIARCYSTGLVTGTVEPGGFNSTDPAQGGTITDCYWDTQTSGMAVSGGGIGKTTAEMKDELTFVGWAFGTIWGLTALCNDAYPCLLGVTPLCVYAPPFPFNKAYAMSRDGVVR